MDRKTTGIVAYLTLIGLIIAFATGDTEGAKFHLNQSLVIMLCLIPAFIPCLGQIWAIFVCVCWFIGFLGALNDEEKEVPLIGKIKLIK